MQASIMSMLSRKSLWVRLLASCIFMGAGMMAIGCDGKPQSVKCYSDRDCPTNFRCEKAKTTTSADVAAPVANKRAPEPCPGGSGTNCAGGPTQPPPTSTAGSCVAIPQPTGCYSDRDCSGGQFCKANSPVPPTKCTTNSKGTTNCFRAPYKGVCVDKPKTNTCSSDRDCASDEICNYDLTTMSVKAGCSSAPEPGGDSSGLRAAPGCGDMPSDPPSTGTCVKRPAVKRCKSNNDCAKDEICAMKAVPGCSGGAVPPTGNKDKADPSETNCFMAPSTDGVCQKRPTPPQRVCYNDRGCKSGEFCNFNAGNTPDDDDAPSDPPQGHADAGTEMPPAPPTRRGVCQKRPVPPQRVCTNDRGCKSGEFCDFNVGSTNTPDDDDAPSDPPQGHADAGMPAPPPPPSRRGVCRSKPKVAFCRYDGDCKRGYRCGKGRASLLIRCAKRGAADPLCVNWVRSHRGICQPAPTKCRQDSDCKRNQKCALSSSEKRADPMPCEPGKNCPAPAPRPEPTQGVCVDVKQPVTCNEDSDCKSNQFCAKTGSNEKRADPMPCDGGTNCTRPAPPASEGVCADRKDLCTTTQHSDGSICTKCGDRTTCTKATP